MGKLGGPDRQESSFPGALCDLALYGPLNPALVDLLNLSLL